MHPRHFLARSAELSRRRLTGLVQPAPAVVKDLAIAIGLALFAVLTQLALVVPTSGPGFPPPPVPVVVVGWACLLVAPLALRRRIPLTVLTITCGHLWFYWATGRVNELATWIVGGIAVYSAAAWGRPRPGRVVLSGCLLALLTAILLSLRGRIGAIELLAHLLEIAMLYVLAWSVGSVVRRLRQYRAELQERTVQLAAEREASARRAVLEERVRMAREVHDVLAHHVSVMAVHSGAARRLFHRRPDAALEAIGEVERAGRQAVTDLHQLLDVLRAEPTDGPDPARAGSSDGSARAPQPRLRELSSLFDHVRHAGLRVEAVIDGGQRSLPPGVELAAYRIVQESLTNTVLHARAATVRVRLAYHPTSLEIVVTDDGQGTPPDDHPAGSPGAGPPSRDETAGHARVSRGLLGMRERVFLHGGTFEAGPQTGGGYRVHALLPALPEPVGRIGPPPSRARPS